MTVPANYGTDYNTVSDLILTVVPMNYVSLYMFIMFIFGCTTGTGSSSNGTRLES